MDCLFKTTTVNTPEEYKRYCLTFCRSRANVLALLIFAVCFFLSGVLFDNPLFMMTGLAVMAYLIISYFMQCRSISKTYISNKLQQNAAIDYAFYDAYFTETTDAGTMTIEYEKLYTIVETKTNFYLMISKIHGYMLLKANFPEGLDVFLREIKKKHAL